MEYVDFHTHLDWYEDESDLQKQLSSFKGTIVAASVDEKSFEKNLKIAEIAHKTNPNLKIIPTFGIHPEKVPFAPENLSVYDEYCEKSPLIGEIGMDFCWFKDAAPEKQEKVLRYFLEHCNKTKKYCVIHTKDAEKQISEILKDYPDSKPIIHWYDGPEDIYDDFVKRGLTFTFGCETIRSKHIQKLLKKTPLNQILAETDNPTSEPWLGGTDNSVNLIKRVYSDISQILNLPLENIAEIINENSRRIIEYSLNLKNQ